MPANPIGRALRNRRAGRDKLVWQRPELQAPERFALTSPSFEHGAPMPDRFRGRIFGANVSPELMWTPPPAGTVELVLIAQDPDVPMGEPGTHVIAVGIDPALGGIPENGLAPSSPVPGIRHGRGVFGRRGWVGPMPPRSHGPHAYVFQLFAVDRRLELPEKFGLAEVLQQLSGHVVARARLDGIFERV